MLGAVAGLAMAVLLGAGLYRGARVINLRTFFRWTGIALIFIAAGLLSSAIHEFIEIGWITIGTGTAFDVSAILPHAPIAGAPTGSPYRGRVPPGAVRLQLAARGPDARRVGGVRRDRARPVPPARSRRAPGEAARGTRAPRPDAVPDGREGRAGSARRDQPEQLAAGEVGEVDLAGLVRPDRADGTAGLEERYRRLRAVEARIDAHSVPEQLSENR